MNEARIAQHQLDDALDAFNSAQQRLLEHLDKEPETFEFPPLKGYRAYAYVLRQIALEAHAERLKTAVVKLHNYTVDVIV